MLSEGSVDVQWMLGESLSGCLFAVASFMLALLALIGLRKSRSFQKPNQITRIFDAFDGRRAEKSTICILFV